jgi:hypothetical protein
MDKKSIIFQYNAFSYTALGDTYRKGIREPFRILLCLFILRLPENSDNHGRIPG